jgi:Rho GTPase-activating protein RGD1
MSSEELERVLLQKEGESLKDNAVQQRVGGTSGGGKRALGKAVAKGGMLLKGKNPGNVRGSGVPSLSDLTLCYSDPETGG